ncbi:hypothetical protein TH25_24365 [Thalassospira profundimaris]|uniref:Uncharacterized protein n=1 Tax=Thalassospira profundimaris TaxID=502049 RepID=A0A367WKE4_9PROT|nr:hypothetical protein TH25_24365 [Thalassospira profundimaris]
MTPCDRNAGFDGFGRSAEKHTGRTVRKPQMSVKDMSGFPSFLPIAIAGGIGDVAMPPGLKGPEL